MKTSRKLLSILLCGCIVLTFLPPILLYLASATAADDLEESMLGTLSARYESNGNPGAIAEVAGDPGGKSYGMYMFASRAGTPKSFFEWCQKSSNAYYQSIGNALYQAYTYDRYGNYSPGYGPLFDEAWRNQAAVNLDGFGRAQRDFVRAFFYDSYLSSIAASVPAFDISNYSIALRNVLWSRAVQHGVGGAVNVFKRAMATLGGFANQSESELINAIYAESGRLTADATPKMTGVSARRYGVEGLSLAYYTGCSSDIQLGVYIRLRINEPANAQAMLAEHGYGDAPIGEGSYLICPAGNSQLSVVAGGTGLTVTGRTGDAREQFRLVYYASGYYTVTNADQSLRLTASDSAVTLAAPAASNSQLWALVPHNSGFALQNRATGKFLSATSFSAGGKVNLSGEGAQWQLVPGAANWTLSGASYPTYANGLKAGSSTFPFRGTLRSTYPITKVRAEVLNSAGATQFFAEAKPNTTFYDLGKMDGAMTFGKLKVGLYAIQITATDTSGSSFSLREPFIVSEGAYTATFDPAGGTCTVTSKTYEPGQVLGELPTPTRPGFRFAGWFDTDGTQYTAASITPARNLALKARYANLYAYTFYDYDGATVLASGYLMAGQTIPAPADPTRPATADTYYIFSGWEGFTPGMTMGEADVSFVARYESHPIADLTEIVATGPYRLADGYLRSIPAGTTAEEILATLSPRESITIRKGDQTVTGAVGTGMTAEFAVGGAVVQSVTIVVTGDVNGDGNVTLTDMVQVRSHLLGKSQLTGAAAQAADLNGDGQLTLTDMVQLRSFMLGRTKITPR